jgi:hypothetical protein
MYLFEERKRAKAAELGFLAQQLALMVMGGLAQTCPALPSISALIDAGSEAK